MVKVSTRSTYIPMPDLSRVEFNHVISLNAKTGEFSTQVPEHIGNSMKSFPNLHGGETSKRIDRDSGKIIEESKAEYTLTSGTLRGLEEGLDKLCYDYVKLMEESKTKILIVTFRANIYNFEPPLDKSDPDAFSKVDHCVLRLEQINFAKDPALELLFDVYYRVGTKYFDLHMHGKGDIDNLGKNTIMLDYTQERFEFFQRAERQLEQMIMRLVNFFENVKEEPALLDQFISKTKLLPGKEE